MQAHSCRPISARKTDFCTYHGRDGGAQLSAELLGVFATVELLPSELRSVGRCKTLVIISTSFVATNGF